VAQAVGEMHAINELNKKIKKKIKAVGEETPRTCE
jgi:hypothetical protein